jgi:hypothetical protein
MLKDGKGQRLGAAAGLRAAAPLIDPLVDAKG